MKKLKLLSIFAMALALAGMSNAADEEVRNIDFLKETVKNVSVSMALLRLRRF